MDPRDGYPIEGDRYALDNGAYRDWRAGVPFDGDRFLARLERFRGRIPHGPDFLVCPDIVAGGMESLEMSLAWKEKLVYEGYDWPLYLAVQDGMPCEDVESALVGFEGLFLGGTSKFKLRAAEFSDVARDAGVCSHYGRCGTPAKVRHAREHGYDSIDSAFPLWKRDRMSVFVAAVLGREAQMRMDL